MTGVIKWFDPIRSFGFIMQEEGPDIFVHYTQIVATGYRSLDKGDVVEFEIGELDARGRCGAIRVVKVSSGDAGVLLRNSELVSP
jgi:CspA family cold shock protein